MSVTLSYNSNYQNHPVSDVKWKLTCVIMRSLDHAIMVEPVLESLHSLFNIKHKGTRMQVLFTEHRSTSVLFPEFSPAAMSLFLPAGSMGLGARTFAMLAT